MRRSTVGTARRNVGKVCLPEVQWGWHPGNMTVKNTSDFFLCCSFRYFLRATYCHCLLSGTHNTTIAKTLAW